MVLGELGQVAAVGAQRVRGLAGEGEVGEEVAHRPGQLVLAGQLDPDRAHRGHQVVAGGRAVAGSPSSCTSGSSGVVFMLVTVGAGDDVSGGAGLSGPVITMKSQYPVCRV